MKNKIKGIFFLLGIISIFLYGISWWFTKTFGEVHILQILWHIENAHSLTGFDEDVVRHFIQFIGVCCAISAAWFFILYKRQYIYIYRKNKRTLFSVLTSKKVDIFFYFSVIFILCYACCTIYDKFSLSDLIHIKSVEYKEENDFILQNYKVPKREEVIFEKKNNLIIILLESISTNLQVSTDDTLDYLSHLKHFYPKYQHHEKLHNCRGTGWTIAALTSWFLGVPLKLPYGVDVNRYTVGSFLPNALSVFDIIKENGFSCHFIVGSSTKFSGKNFLFNRGDFEIHDFEYFEAHNKVTEQNKGGWGVFDYFIYEETYAKYLELREKKEPFVLFMETVDTHFPGYCPKDKVQYGDMRDALLNADAMLYDFLKKMEPFLETDNVNILVFGDHTIMGEIAQFNSGSSLFNLFMGRNVPQIPDSKLQQTINPMDIAPTILQAAGAKWGNDQFGLGISIFSEDKSFSETEGITGLDEKLLYYSKFYDSFF